MLGDFHDDAVEVAGERRRYGGMAQGVRTHVDGQSHAGWQLRPPEQSRSNARGFEFCTASRRMGHGEDLLDWGWSAREPGESFRRHNRAGRHLDDRLQDNLDRAKIVGTASAPTAQAPDAPSPCVHSVTARVDAYWCFPVHGR